MNRPDRTGPLIASVGLFFQIYDVDPNKDREDLSDHDAGGIIPGVKPDRVLAKPWTLVRLNCLTPPIAAFPLSPNSCSAGKTSMLATSTTTSQEIE